jgi:hypothetical protein
MLNDCTKKSRTPIRDSKQINIFNDLILPPKEGVVNEF